MELPNLDNYRALVAANEERMRREYRFRVYCVKGLEFHYRASYATADLAFHQAQLWANSAYLPHYTYIVVDSQKLHYIEPNEKRNEVR